jgi:hypothetical protein
MSRNVKSDLQKTGNRVGRNISVALRAERVIAQRRVAAIRKQTGMMAFAGLVAGIGVVMINVAAFFGLATSLGNAWAAVVVAMANFAIAALVALLASRADAEKDLDSVIEVRDLAMEEIEAELGDALDEARDLAANVRRIARDPLGTAGLGLIVPVLTLLAKTLKK